MGAILSVVAVTLWLALPGILALACLPAYRGRPATSWILGSILGLATASTLQTVVSYWALSSFHAVWIVISLATLLGWWKSGRPALWARPDRLDLTVGTVLFALAAIRAVLILRNELPNGWDPSFHCILAENIYQRNGMIFDWKPFEDISLNYPVAGFVGIAWTKQLTGIESHIIHKTLQALHNVLTAAAVYLLSSRVGGSREVGLWSCAVFGFWALAGNLQYFIYGGFPNQLGMLYILAAYLFLTEEPRTGPRKLLASWLFAAVFLTHHHVLLSTFLVIAMLAFYDLIWGKRARAIELVQTLVGGAALCSFYLVPYALKAITLGNTSVATYPEPAYGPFAVVELIGPLYLLAIGYGIWLAKRRGFTQSEKQILAVCLCLVLLFVGLDWFARYLRWMITGKAFGLFTPWRFLCNATPLLAYFAGCAALDWSKKSKLPASAGLVVVAVLSLTNQTTYRDLWNPNYSPEVLRASRFIKENTPPDTIVLTPFNWVAHLSQRRIALTPIPSSEPSNKGTPKRLLVESIFKGQVPPLETGPMVCDLRYGVNWPGTKILWVDPEGDPKRPLVVVQLLHFGGLVPMEGWSLDPW